MQLDDRIWLDQSRFDFGHLLFHGQAEETPLDQTLGSGDQICHVVLAWHDHGRRMV